MAGKLDIRVRAPQGKDGGVQVVITRKTGTETVRVVGRGDAADSALADGLNALDKKDKEAGRPADLSITGFQLRLPGV